MIARGLIAAALVLTLVAAASTRSVSSQGPDAEAIARAYLAQSSRLVPIPETVSGLAPAQLRSAAVAAAPANRQLDHVVTQESAGARHVRFQETEDGIPIFGGQVVVNVSKQDDEVGFVSDHRTSATVASSGIGVNAGRGRAISPSPPRTSSICAATRTRPWSTTRSTNQLYLAWQFILPAADPLGDWLVVVLAGDGRRRPGHQRHDQRRRAGL